MAAATAHASAAPSLVNAAGIRTSAFQGVRSIAADASADRTSRMEVITLMRS